MPGSKEEQLDTELKVTDDVEKSVPVYTEATFHHAEIWRILAETCRSLGIFRSYHIASNLVMPLFAQKHVVWRINSTPAERLLCGDPSRIARLSARPRERLALTILASNVAQERRNKTWRLINDGKN